MNFRSNLGDDNVTICKSIFGDEKRHCVHDYYDVLNIIDVFAIEFMNVHKT